MKTQSISTPVEPMFFSGEGIHNHSKKTSTLFPTVVSPTAPGGQINWDVESDTTTPRDSQPRFISIVY